MTFADIVAVLFLMYLAAKTAAAHPWMMGDLGHYAITTVDEVRPSPTWCNACWELKQNHNKVYKNKEEAPPLPKCRKCTDGC